MSSTSNGDRLGVHFSSRRSDWETPDDLFAALHREFAFTVDVCAQPHNAKLAAYFSPEQDGLAQRWTGTAWCNPPFGKQIGRWVEKAIREARAGATVVLLVPARFDTCWGGALLDHADEVRIIDGRLRFVGATDNAPFPCAVVVLRPQASWASGDSNLTYRLPTRHAPGARWTTLKVVRDAD